MCVFQVHVFARGQSDQAEEVQVKGRVRDLEYGR